MMVGSGARLNSHGVVARFMRRDGNNSSKESISGAPYFSSDRDVWNRALSMASALPIQSTGTSARPAGGSQTKITSISPIFERAVVPEMALFGPRAMSDLSPDCAPKRRSASATGTLRKLTEMTDPDPSPFANCHVIVCYGGAGLFDKH